MRRRTHSLVLFWLLAVLAGKSLKAVDASAVDQTDPADLKKLTLEELSQIEITSPSKEPQDAFRAPVAIYVITGDEIRRSGATSIPEALRLAPGVEVARIDANKWSIGIRGFGSRLSRDVLVIIDGRIVYTPLFAGTYWEVQDTMMEDIDRIEVIRGPGGTVWGPNAVDGVINVVTKSSKDTQGILAAAGGGNEEQGFVDFRYGGSGGNDLTYRFYAKGFTRSPEYHPDGRNFDDWRAAQSGFRMDWNKTSRDAITLQGDIYKEEAGEDVSVTTYAPPYSRIVDANADLGGGNLLGRWQHTLTDGGNFQFQAYYDRTSRFEPNLEEIRNTYDVDFLHKLPVKARQVWTWGLGARLSPSYTPIVVTGLQFLPIRETDRLITGFVQDEISIVPDRVTMTIGTKLLNTNFTPFALQPTARLSWTPTRSQTIWLAFTHAVRTPSRAEEDFNLLGLVGILSSGIPYLARFNANPNFAPEQLNSYEAGYRKLIGKNIYIDIAAFYNHYHDLFSEDIIGVPFLESTPPPLHLLLPAQFRNDLLGETEGTEIAPEWRPAKFWRLRGSYSFLNIDLHNQPGTFEVGTAPIIEGSSPQHQALAESSFDLGKKLQLDLTYRYVSALTALNVPGYSTGDARIAYRLHRGLQLEAIGRNLLQPWHYEYSSDPSGLVGIKRSGYLRLTWTH